MSEGDDQLLDDEAVQNLFDQMYDLYLEDALIGRGLSPAEMTRAQIVFYAPFKDPQFDHVDADDSDVEVRINDEVVMEVTVTLDSDAEIDTGDPVPYSMIEEFHEDIVIPDLGEDVGHITFMWLPNGGLNVWVDTLYNKSYIEPLLKAADEFIELATVARDRELLRAFVETAMHAAERMMKIRVIQHGDAAFDHDIIRRNYSKYVDAGMGNPALLDAYKQLKDNYRYPGSYVDPGDHYNGIDEKEFDLDPGVVDELLDVIVEHREAVRRGRES